MKRNTKNLKNENIFRCQYFSIRPQKRKSDTQLAKQKIEIIVDKLSITDIGRNDVLQSLKNKMVNDFEDGIEYHAPFTAIYVMQL